MRRFRLNSYVLVVAVVSALAHLFVLTYALTHMGDTAPEVIAPPPMTIWLAPAPDRAPRPSARVRVHTAVRPVGELSPLHVAVDPPTTTVTSGEAVASPPPVLNLKRLAIRHAETCVELGIVHSPATYPRVDLTLADYSAFAFRTSE